MNRSKSVPVCCHRFMIIRRRLLGCPWGRIDSYLALRVIHTSSKALGISDGISRRGSFVRWDSLDIPWDTIYYFSMGIVNSRRIPHDKSPGTVFSPWDIT